jgi:hypothetical protein
MTVKKTKPSDRYIFLITGGFSYESILTKNKSGLIRLALMLMKVNR